MKKQRTWFSLLSFCIVTALGASLAFALIIAGGSVALASHQGAVAEETQEISPDNSAQHAVTTFTGLITDSHCGARHMRKSNQNSVDCARACYRKGASYMLVDGNRRYTLIGGEDALNRLIGERAKVTGSLQDGVILVDSAAPAL